MLCGITLFEKYITDSQIIYLENKFRFGSFFDLSDGNEIPIPSRKSFHNSYERMIWRRAIYKHFELLMGYKFDQLTGKEYRHLKVNGSIHKYSFDGNNAGVFTAKQAVNALNNLCQELGINSAKAKITSLEIGINIIDPPFSVNEYCKLSLLRYKTFPFEWMKSNNKKVPIGKEAILSHRRIKIYSKPSTLRFEIHYDDMQDLREKYNLIHPVGVTEKLLINMAQELLLGTFRDVVSLDGIMLEERYLPDGINKKDHQVLKDYCNSVLLAQIESLIIKAKAAGNIKEAQRLYKKHKRGRDRFQALIHLHGKKYHEYIMKEIDKLIQLSDNKEKCPKVDIGIKVNKWTKDNLLNTNNRNNTNRQMGTTSVPVTKSKKQLLKEKRELKEKQFQSFLNALGIVLEKAEKETTVTSSTSKKHAVV